MAILRHTCPVPGCRELVRQERLMCSRHWYQVPLALRKQVWREYRKAPQSRAHLWACHRAVEAVRAEAPGQ